ncbi:cell envelope integrity protein TolA [Tardiphaga sp. 866_E4_N2_1]|uniref:cell envelope integrity protein TolA n=1 Tax=unclassified Tardiphaga TaxID=2631404 RepID=UPI003F220512
MTTEKAEGSALNGFIIMGVLTLFPGLRKTMGILTILLVVGGAIAVFVAGTGRDLHGFPIKNDPYEMLRLGGSLTIIVSIMTFAFWAGSHLIEIIGGRAAKRFGIVEDNDWRSDDRRTAGASAFANEAQQGALVHDSLSAAEADVRVPLDMQWHIFSDEAVHGPFSGRQISGFIKAKQFSRNVLVSTDKGISWGPATNDPVLSGYISSRRLRRRLNTYIVCSVLGLLGAGAAWLGWQQTAKPQSAGTTPMPSTKLADSLPSPIPATAPSGSPSTQSNAQPWGMLFARQMGRCWIKPPPEFNSPNMEAKFAVKLKPDGSLDGQPTILSPVNSPYSKSYHQNALQAIIRCQPYALPAKDYAAWQRFEPVFSERRN